MSWLFRGRSRDKTATLSINTPRVHFYRVLDPTIPTDELLPPSVIEGVVTLKLTEPRQCPGMVISLDGIAKLHDRDGHSQTSTLLEIETSVICGPHLDAGVHSFPFGFEVPRSVAPSETSDVGQISYTVRARAPDLNVHADRDVLLAAHSHPEGTAPPSLNIRLEGHHPELEAYDFAINGDMVTLGGFLGCDWNLQAKDNAKKRRMRAITMSIRQTVQVNPPSKSKVGEWKSEKSIRLAHHETDLDNHPLVDKFYSRLTTGIEGAEERSNAITHRRLPDGRLAVNFQIDVPNAPRDMQCAYHSIQSVDARSHSTTWSFAALAEHTARRRHPHVRVAQARSRDLIRARRQVQSVQSVQTDHAAVLRASQVRGPL